MFLTSGGHQEFFKEISFLVQASEAGPGGLQETVLKHLWPRALQNRWAAFQAGRFSHL